MGKYYLAVDIGASSGRHILGCIKNGKICIEEIYRFENAMVKKGGMLLWDTGHLFEEILNGMKQCRKLNKIPVSMSVDTWAVDYVLLDENDEVLGDVYGYRDVRTKGMEEEVYKSISYESLYKRTGIQKQVFNTIYQLMDDKLRRPDVLKKAECFLMLPDYFQFLLTGRKVSEYTNGTSTQLVSLETSQWDFGLIKLLGFPEDIFLPLKMPGNMVGNLTNEIERQVGFNCKVVLCASHDTASAVMAMPAEGEGIFLSSGTWSLMGVENRQVKNDEISMQENFTNEGGYQYRYRYLKNIMGLWMIQSVRHEREDKYSFAQICEMAEECKDFPSVIDVNSSEFLAPDNMEQAVKDYCKNTGQRVPETLGEVASVIYKSLADCYGKTVKKIEELTGKTYEGVYIIGGGSNADYLNQLTADATKKTVYAGPGEATAIGNLMAQIMADEGITDLAKARKQVYESFNIKTYKPTKKV